MNQNHILNCQEYEECFETTAAEYNKTAEEMKETLQSRSPEACTREEQLELNELEDHLSAQLLTKISGMSRPERARV